MINAKELRIGNLVLHQLTKEPYKIKAYDILDLEKGMDSEILQPLPLTEELLIKFGFVLNNESKYNEHWEHDDIDYLVRKTGSTFAFCLDDYEDGHTTHFIMHTDKVHTFQNNAFSLTQKELNIK